KVALCSRNREELDRIVEDLEARGQQALAIECDVADPDAVEAAAQATIDRFGRIDTWVNNAGVSIYGKLWETRLDEKRRLFDVNFWGVVHGCRTASKLLRMNGGAIINIGSVLSERSIPIQGIYAASKHAVKAYTDALRMELEAEKLPISVTLIKPAAIDTPYTEHALNHMEHKPVHTAPVYAPELVANAILECAVHPKRDVHVGGAGVIYALMESFMPRFLDFAMEKTMMESGQSDKKLDGRIQRPALRRHPKREGQVRGEYPGHVMESSVLTSASLHPMRALALTVSFGALIAGVAYAFRSSKRPNYKTLSGEMKTMKDRVTTHSVSY
ncbi:MAG: SDR family oxidoreductase, partial [Bdellovibrionota bacterium]